MRFLQLNFLPRTVDLALLLLRIWFGASMLWLHGRMKISNFAEYSGKFADPFGVGPGPSLVLVIFAEVVCAGLLVIGAFTRLAALILAFTMLIAFWVGHGGKLTGPGNGEMAFLFLGAYLVLFLAGAGRFALDPKLGAKG